MFFRDIIGKEDIKHHLINTVTKGRIPHAQIFLGREGFGGLPLALAYASYIMCTNRGENDSCGNCPQCNKTHKYIHPDIHFAYPVVKHPSKNRAETTSVDFISKWREIITIHPFLNTGEWLQHIGAENTAPNINVKECNDILVKLNLTTYESDYKVLVMWLPEYLGVEGNRLLKFIEEPTDYTYIIFVSENQENILQTILSRCQLVKIPPFEDSEIMSMLQSKFELTGDKAQQIAFLSDGNINLAMNIMRGEALDYSELILDWMRAAYKSDPVMINDWISNITTMTKDSQVTFLKYALHFFRQLVYRILTNSNEVQMTAKELEAVDKMSAFLSVDKCRVIIDLINEGLENILRNVNVKIMLFSDTLQIGKTIRKK
ncbi:MAG: hypothetical protein WAU01_10790 [Saprospiraceae bacterium]